MPASKGLYNLLPVARTSDKGIRMENVKIYVVMFVALILIPMIICTQLLQQQPSHMLHCRTDGHIAIIHFSVCFKGCVDNAWSYT